MVTASFDELVKVAGPVSRETYAILQEFLVEFQRWNRITNLVAPSTIDESWSRHVLDSAQLKALAPEARQWVDLGSGGGFPGLVMAILLRETQEARVHLVESNRKKASFLQAMVGRFSLQAVVHPRRIEEISGKLAGIEAISSRALTSLAQLLTLSEPLFAAGARAYFHKGRDYRREIEESAHAWTYDLLEHPSAVDSQGVILEISNLRRKAR
ncbi:16S rRNA (guanine(527)-N(7))-methyltransferase RsmG [Mesorhizobium sp. LHD-90]|uniref:16S rRNA (guanine(527)-N(7))-methyltransferase RsmG n=1 Tax=Mesorhizobium sp. LHD-90 TaxID=3071414 RepID=UPI0027E01637|nr:16S rRNA (guanine(527)-N(7))-methyltransferase RsmG [Mesorhizobium sp. LHD-90]MDQ6434160.1 16S rRNA (guanine(527)-N(7))-methyltransferase RsmG [Mesorhizobium sp. LHD-90]